MQAPPLAAAAARPANAAASSLSLPTRLAWALLLGVGGFLLNLIQVPLLSAETPEFVFGGVAVLLAFTLLGVVPGIVTALVSLSGVLVAVATVEPGLLLVVIVYTLEGLGTYVLYRRIGSLVVSVVIFWFGLGWGLDLLVYGQLRGITGSYLWLLFAKQVLNGVLNALVAEGLLELPRFRDRLATNQSLAALGLARLVFRRVTLVVMVPALVLALTVTQTLFRKNLDLVRASLLQNTRQLARGAEGFVADRRIETRQLAREIEIALEEGDSELPRTLARFRAEHPVFAGVEVLPLPLVAVDGSFDATAAGERTRVTLTAGVEGDDGLHILEPLRAPNHETRAVLVAAVGPEVLRRELFAQPLAPAQTATFVSARLAALSSPHPWFPVLEPLPTELRSALLARSEGIVSYLPPARDTPESRLGLDLQHAAFHWLEEPRAAILVDVPAASVHGTLRSAVVTVLAFLGGTVGLLAAGVGFFSRKLSRPLQLMEAASAEIAEGRRPPAGLLEPLGRSEVAEIRSLAAHFARMQESIAYRDSLTGLANRDLLLERLDRRLREMPGHQRLAIFYIDLDGYREIDDSAGRGVAEGLLRRVALELEASAGPSDLVARTGEDEFTVVAEVRDRLPEITARGDRLRELVRRIGLDAPAGLPLTASVGISLHPEDGDRPEDLVRKASAAAHEAQEDGLFRDHTRLFAPEMQRRALDRLNLTADLARAVRQRQIELHCQPIVDLADGAVRAVEVLARWQHPERGPVPPGDFVALAEASDLIADLDLYVLERVVARLTGELASESSLRWSLNLSARNLRDPRFAERFHSVLSRAGVAGSALQIEVTESFPLRERDFGFDFLQSLRDLGLRICIDDFGTGHASFAYLRNLPIDVLKLDRTYVASLPRDPSSRGIARATLALGSELGLEVVAEGVETREQLHRVRELGFHAAQGYLIGRPMPAGALRDWLAQDRGRFGRAV